MLPTLTGDPARGLRETVPRAGHSTTGVVNLLATATLPPVRELAQHGLLLPP